MEDNQKQPILSPFKVQDLMGGVQTAKKSVGISNNTFNRILSETGGKAAIVIVFDKQAITEEDLKIAPRHFHFSMVNMTITFVPYILKLVVQALLGELGGKTTIKTQNNL